MPGPIVSYHPLVVADQNLLLESQRPLDGRDREAVAGAAAVLLPQLCRRDLHDLAAASGRPYFPRQAARFLADGKVGNRRLFAALGLPQPRSLEYPDLAGAAAAWRAGEPARAGLTPPLVVKGAPGGMGENVFLVHEPGDLEGLAGRLETAHPLGPSGLVLQEYLETGGRDARVVRVGSWVDAFWRKGADGGFKANLSQGGRVERGRDGDGLEAARELALHLLERAEIDVAAVDLLVPRGQGPLLLELNFYFARAALGGNAAYARVYLEAVRSWLDGLGLDPGRVSLEE